MADLDYDFELENITFTLPNDNQSCGTDGYFFNMRSYRPWVFHIGSVNTFFIIIFNTMVVKAFKQKGLLSSATVPLIVLAICDIMASIFMFWPKEAGFYFHMYHIDASMETDVFLRIAKVNYPFCIVSEVSYYLAHVFHSSSFVVTSLVAVQKALVIQFPLWSKVNLMKQKTALVTTLLLVFACFCLNASLVMYTIYQSENSQWCCRRLNYVKTWNANGHKQVLFVCYTICFSVLVISSLYIAFRLTCDRRRKKYDSRFIRKKHRRSALIVMLVACFCIMTELIPFCCRSIAHLKQLCTNDIHQFELLILQFGFAVNFIIYIAMSEKLRSKIIFCCRKAGDHSNATQSSRGQISSLISLNHNSIYTNGFKDINSLEILPEP